MGAFDETHVVGTQGAKSHVFDQPVKLVNADGSDFGGGSEYTLPAATTATLGGVKMAAVTATAKKTSADAAGEAPTAAEFNAVRAELEEVKTVVNAVITSMRAAGQAADK